MIGIKVSKSKAEDVRQRLRSISALDEYRIPITEDGSVIFPLVRKVDFGDIVDRNFKYSNKERNIKDMLRGRIDPSLLDTLPSSHDIIGDIVILDIPEKIEKYGRLIAESILESRKNINAVFKRSGVYKGITRIREIVFLAGENKTEALHKENSVSMRIDVKNTYFSPRSSTERRRIADLVKDGENILVMFSGCAPFPLVIAGNSRAKKIVGIEINEKACRLAEENVIINKFSDRIELYCGDVRDILPSKFKDIKFDRILMPLPKDAETFLDLSLDHIKEGGMIHLYLFLNERSKKEKIQDIEKQIKLMGSEGKVIDTIKCGQYGPGIFRYSFDILIG